MTPVSARPYRALIPSVPKRLLILSDEQYELLRAAAYLQGCRTGKLLRDMLSEGLERLAEDQDVQRLVRVARLERSRLRAV
jgi:hypothetical protein